MNNAEFETKVAKIIKAWGISSSVACEADENCDDFERGSDEWFVCFEASIEALLNNPEE